jgi:malonyl-CoA O-methyltransferase
VTALKVQEGYRLWAPTYAAETAISWLEAQLVDSLTPPLAGKRLLDAGCGTGRRIRETGAYAPVGVDLSPEMLRAGSGLEENPDGTILAVGDIRALPLPDRAFDVVWCRLVIGHLPDCQPAYAEFARVAAAAARVIVTDFHPDAHAAGHRRTFRAGGTVHELEHHVHPIQAHVVAAKSVGLALIGIREGRIGPEVLPFYARAGRASLYEAHEGLPVVLALRFAPEGRA